MKAAAISMAKNKRRKKKKKMKKMNQLANENITM